MKDVVWQSNSDEWETPQDLYEGLNAEFDFNLDPCATDDNHKCPMYYTQQEDGLQQSWGGAESFAIRHTVRLRHGCGKPMRKAGKTEQ